MPAGSESSREAELASVSLMLGRIPYLMVGFASEVNRMTFTVEYEREDDGRWLAEVLELPGVLAYGNSSDEAIAKAQALALRAVADQLEHGEAACDFVDISFAAA